jgi:membrane-bound lytic murein transglycosylase A
MRFVMLAPKSLDPVARGRKMPLPDPRPSEEIAKLFPPVDPSEDQQTDRKNGAPPAAAAPGAKDTPNAAVATKAASPTAARPAAAATQTATAQAAVIQPVPLPEARPNIEPGRGGRHYRHFRRYRRLQ